MSSQQIFIFFLFFFSQQMIFKDYRAHLFAQLPDFPSSRFQISRKPRIRASQFGVLIANLEQFFFLKQKLKQKRIPVTFLCCDHLRKCKSTHLPIAARRYVPQACFCRQEVRNCDFLARSSERSSTFPSENGFSSLLCIVFKKNWTYQFMHLLYLKNFFL